MNNFKIGDIVLFSWKPNYAPWRKGKIVANNFAMCNLPDFFGKPTYYITEVDDNNNVLDDRKTIAVDKDSEYILKFLPGMEAMIGKSTQVKNIHAIDIEKDIEEELPEQTADIKLITIKENEELWKERIEKKLDDINDKLNKLLLGQRTWTDPYPVHPLIPGTPINPWYKKPYYDPRDFQVWCDTTTTHNDTSKLEAKVKPGDHDYIMRCNPDNTTTTTMTFDYKKYNDMCTCTDKEINAKYENSCLDAKCYNARGAMDGAIDTWGLAAASKKINKNNKKK